GGAPGARAVPDRQGPARGRAGARRRPPAIRRVLLDPERGGAGRPAAHPAQGLWELRRAGAVGRVAPPAWFLFNPPPLAGGGQGEGAARVGARMRIGPDSPSKPVSGRPSRGTLRQPPPPAPLSRGEGGLVWLSLREASIWLR